MRKCATCKNKKVLTEFRTKKNGEYYVSCNVCKEKSKKYYQEKKVQIINQHKIRYEEHKDDILARQKIYYEEHKEKNKCEHNINRRFCRVCFDNPLHLIFRNMIIHSKYSDIKYNRYEEEKFITYNFLQVLFDRIKDEPICYHCKTRLHYGKRDSKLITIERLDNKIGHNKDNCVFACWKCNNHHQDK